MAIEKFSSFALKSCVHAHTTLTISLQLHCKNTSVMATQFEMSTLHVYIQPVVGVKMSVTEALKGVAITHLECRSSALVV